VHVGLVSHGYPDKGAAGGIGTATRTLAHALASIGHGVTVIAEDEDVGEGRFKDGPVSVVRYRPGRFFYRAAFRILSALPIRQPRKDRLRQLVYSLQRAAEIDALLRRLVREEGIEVVEFPEWDFPAFFFVRRPPVPAVIKIHSPHFLIEDRLALPPYERNYAKMMCERAALRRADLVVGVASAVALRVARKYNIPGNRLAVVPHPFRLDGIAEKLPGRESTGLVVQVGRIELTKGADITARAIPKILERVPRARFRFIGEPGYHQYSRRNFTDTIRSALEKAGVSDRVEFTGLVPHSEVPGLLAEADVLLLPSRFENYSISLLEAMYVGTAIVATDVGGNAEVLDGGKAGVLVPPRDPVALADAAALLLTNHEKRERIRRHGWNLVRTRNNLERIAGRTAGIYGTLISMRRRRR